MNDKKTNAAFVTNCEWLFLSPAIANLSRPLVFLGLIFSLALAAAAQAVPLDAHDIEPPPMKIISKGERGQLDAQRDIKQRTKLALELMHLRLKSAETSYAAADFKTMFSELGGFHALMENTLAFLNMAGSSEGKILDNYKRFELGIRPFMPRLELIRRELPDRFDPYVKNLVRSVRDARTKAVEPLFGNTVVPNRPQE